MKTGRVHHLLSDLEAKIFHTYDFIPIVTDIREQYPLWPLEETIAIAEACGVVHPTDPYTRKPVVMTTDIFLTVREAGGSTYWARTIKYEKSLANLRALEKLEIERRYWKVRNISWRILSECDVDLNFVANVKWFRPYFRVADLYPLTSRVINRVAVLLTRRVLDDDLPLCEVARICDVELGLSEGSCLAIARHLLANQVWRADMHRRIHPTERLRLLRIEASLIPARRCA